MPMRHVLLTAGLLLGPVVAGAQQVAPAAPAGLSLADAIAIARDKNPAYRQVLNDRGPAAWGVRGAFTSLFVPNVTATGGMSYTGPGSQTFLSSSFSQSVSTVSSFYDLSLNWQLSGATLSQPWLAKAQQHAVDADIAGAAPAPPDHAPGAQRRVPEARAGALQRRPSHADRRTPGAGRARPSGRRPAPRPDARQRGEAAPVPTDGRDAAYRRPGGAAHRHVRRPDAGVAADRLVDDGRGAESGAQGAAGAGGGGGVGCASGHLELRTEPERVGRVVGLHATIHRRRTADSQRRVCREHSLRSVPLQRFRSDGRRTPGRRL